MDAAAFSTRGVAETGDAETGDDEDDVDVDVGVDEDEDDVEVDDDDEVEVDEDDDVGLALSREIPAGVEDEPEPADPLLSPDAEAAGDVAPVDLPSRGDEGVKRGTATRGHPREARSVIKVDTVKFTPLGHVRQASAQK